MTTMLGISLAGRAVVMVGGGAVTARRLRAIPRRRRRASRSSRPSCSDAVPRARRCRRCRVDPAARARRATSRTRGSSTPRPATRASTPTSPRRASVAASCASTRRTARTARRASPPRPAPGDVVVGVVSDAGVDPRRAGRLRDAIGALLREGALPAAAPPPDRHGPRRPRRRRPWSRRPHDGARAATARRGRRRDRRPARSDRRARRTRSRRRGHRRRQAPRPSSGAAGARSTPCSSSTPAPASASCASRAAIRSSTAAAAKRSPRAWPRACPVEVVPGLTSVVSVPQAAGIPVTHRGSAASVHVVNGQAETSPSTLAALADDTVTTVVLMGVAALPRLVAAAAARRRARRPPGRDRRARAHARSSARHARTLARAVDGCRRRRCAQPRRHRRRRGRPRRAAPPRPRDGRWRRPLTSPPRPTLSAALEGCTIVIAVDRRSTELAAALERHGAQVRPAPALTIVPHIDDEALIARTRELIANPPEVVVAIDRSRLPRLDGGRRRGGPPRRPARRALAGADRRPRPEGARRDPAGGAHRGLGRGVRDLDRARRVPARRGGRAAGGSPSSITDRVPTASTSSSRRTAPRS